MNVDSKDLQPNRKYIDGYYVYKLVGLKNGWPIIENIGHKDGSLHKNVGKQTHVTFNFPFEDVGPIGPEKTPEDWL